MIQLTYINLFCFILFIFIIRYTLFHFYPNIYINGYLSVFLLFFIFPFLFTRNINLSTSIGLLLVIMRIISRKFESENDLLNYNCNYSIIMISSALIFTSLIILNYKGIIRSYGKFLHVINVILIIFLLSSLHLNKYNNNLLCYH
jgi:hypothetical protein